MLLVTAGLQAQWINVRLANIPRMPDGTPDLDAPASRLPDGKVDFSGIWYPDVVRTDPTRSPVGQTLGEDPVMRLVTADGSPLPVLPAAEAADNARRQRRELGAAPQCLPHSVVDGLLVPTPFKIVHSPALTLVLLEEFMHFQQVFTDGRGFPVDMQPAWFGYSIGRWEGEDFVIETKGLNDRADLGTTPGSLRTTETLHLTERFHRPTFGSLELRVTFDDPQTFSKVWTTRAVWFKLLPDTDFIENICDNEKDAQRIKAITDSAR